MPTCSIKQCSASKNINQPGLSLHRFPTNEIQRRKWVQVIGIENINPHHKKLCVCSLHFDEACFNRTLDVIRLRDGAIPSYRLPISLDKTRPGNRQKNIAKKSCRACLASEVRLFSIHDNNLANSYYQLVGISLKDTLSQHLCGICATMLRKFAQFRERCQKAYSLLSDEKSYNKTINDFDVTTCIPLPYSKTDVQIHEYIYTLEEYIDDFDLKQEQEEYVDKEEFDDFDNVIIDEFVNNIGIIYNIDKHNTSELKNCDNDGEIDADDEIEDLEIENEDSDSDEDSMTVAYLVNNAIVYKKEKIPKIDNAINNQNLNAIPKAKENKEMPKTREIDEITKSKEMKEMPKTREINEKTKTEIMKGMPKTREINEITKTKEINERPKTREELKAFAESYEFNVKFFTEEEQYKEIEERKRQAISKEGSLLTVCDYCGKSFPSKQRLETHYKKNHDPSAGKFLCNICHCRFLRRSTLTQHLANHQVLFECKICTYNSKWHTSLMNHSLSHKGKVLVCEYCQKICNKITSYFSHVRLQHASELPWCEICSESFVNKRGVKYHMSRAHKGVVFSFECTVCGKKFISQEALDRHVGIKKCDLDCCVHCGEGFASLQLLKYHLIQVHTPESLCVNCEGCGVKFHSAAALQRHLWKCGNAACCVQCGEHFDDESLMRDHVVKEHSDFKCEECNKTFTNAFYYKYHVSCHPGQHGIVKRGRRRGYQGGPSKKVGLSKKSGRVKKWRPGHDGEVMSEREPRAPEESPAIAVCEVCGISFSNIAKLHMHLQLHSDERPFQCDRCPKAFKTAIALEYHMRVHTGERPHKCKSCPKAFKLPTGLARHELVHSGVRNHMCQICEKTFQTSSCVKMHIKYVHMKIPAPKRIRRRKLKSGDNKQ